MLISKPRSHCRCSLRCVPVKRAGKSDKPQNSPFPAPPPPPSPQKMIVFTTVGKARVVFLVLPRCRYGAYRPVCPGFTTVVYGGVPATAGHASVMSRCFPVLKIIASGEKHSNTGMYRDTTGSNLGSPWTFLVFGFRLECSD